MLRDLPPVRRRLEVGDRVVDREGTEFTVTTVGMKIVHLRVPGTNTEVSRFVKDVTLVPPKPPAFAEVKKRSPEEEFLDDV